MKNVLLPLFALFVAATPLAAAAQVHGGNAAARCSVQDMDAFERFIAIKPTPVEFRAQYSCVLLATADVITTKEMRADNSRYFPQLDQYGRIVGGSFR